jgi:hypothetical protein
MQKCFQFMIGKNNKLVERLKFLDMCHVERFFWVKFTMLLEFKLV